MKTPINVPDLLTRGFVQVGKHDHYRLIIVLHYPGERRIEVSLLPDNKWMAYYEVNGVAASKAIYTIEEIDSLYLAITGQDKQNCLEHPRA